MSLQKGEIWTHRQTHIEEGQCEITHEAEGHPQAEGRELEQILPSQPSEGANLAPGTSAF